jgi:hypothetical protein
MMKEKLTSNLGTIPEPIKRDYPKLIVEEGEVSSLDRVKGELKRLKEYPIGEERNRGDPVTIGREAPETIGKKDILVDKRYRSVSRHHAEINFDENDNSYFLVDYSLNGTLVNGKKVGGTQVRETRRLEHEDLIEVPAVGEKVVMRFLMYERMDILSWAKGQLPPPRRIKRKS